MRIGCARERDVQVAATSGRWTTALSAHAATCATCGEVALVARALAAPVPPLERATNPARLFAEARFARRLRAEAQVSQVILMTQVASALAILTVLLYFLGPPAAWIPTFQAFPKASLLGVIGLGALAGSGLAFRLLDNRR